MDSDNEQNSTLLTTLEIGVESSSSTNIPEKSRRSYEITYNQFMDWRISNQINSISEQVLMTYFAFLSSKYKSSTLYSIYSMLRSTLNIHHNIKIEEYHKLRSFLKQTGKNYQPQKAKTLTPEEINTFITQAPDEVYLVTKVALIMGIMGACRATELYAMQIQDLKDLNTAFFVTVPNSNSKVSRRFTITDSFYNICKKYVNLRVPNISPFFLNYHKGKCSIQRMGINNIGRMGKEVARYLKLPNPGLYTGRCFRSSSANLLVDGGGDITDLKRLGGWKKPSDITDSFIIDEALNKLHDIAQNSVQQMNPSSANQWVSLTRNNLIPNYGLQEHTDLGSQEQEIHIKHSLSDEETILDIEDLEMDNTMPVKPMYVDIHEPKNAEPMSTNDDDILCTNNIDVNNKKEIIYQQIKIIDEESKRKIELMEKETEAKIKCIQREHEAKIKCIESEHETNLDYIKLKKEILHKEIELLNVKINKEKS